MRVPKQWVDQIQDNGFRLSEFVRGAMQHAIAVLILLPQEVDQEIINETRPPGPQIDDFIQKH